MRCTIPAVIASEAKAIHGPAQRKNGLLRFARNDENKSAPDDRARFR